MEAEVLDRRIEIDGKLIEESEREIRRQLDGYSRGERSRFDLGIDFPGGFTGRVMQLVRGVGYGETSTYGEVAEELGSSAVAVGQACGRNPLPVIIPCHRIVGENSTGGYLYGREFKEKLLELESGSKCSR